MQQAFNSEVAPTKIVPLVRTPDAMVHRILEVAAPCLCVDHHGALNPL